MKIKRALSVILSAFMLFSLLGITPVTAAETTEPYTLSELMEMSDEEFLALEGAEIILTEIKQGIPNDESEYSGIISGQFTTSAFDKRYQANISENSVNKLLSDSFEFIISSPINSSGVYNYIYSVNLADYYGKLTPANDENVLIHAKTLYCLRQACDFNYVSVDSFLSAPTNESIISGDVNVDTAVDLYDVIWIASDLADIFKLTESQQKVGDVNEDGVCDLYDAIAIAETIMEK